MSIQELPPPISPRQMNILRAVAAMAWADGQLEPDEIHLMLDEFAMLFANSETEQEKLKSRLGEYLEQNLPLEEIVPSIKSVEDRKLTLKLAYQVIQSSRRNPDEPLINLDEAAAYQRLVRILALSPEDVSEVEQAIAPAQESHPSEAIKDLATKLHSLISSSST